MTLRLSILISLSLLAFPLKAEEPDSIAVKPVRPDSVPSYLLPVETPPTADPDVSVDWQYNPEYQRAISDVNRRAPNFKNTDAVVPGVAPIASWNGGGFYASGGTASHLGMMNQAFGRLNFSQRFGRFSLTAFVAAEKYGYFRGLQTQYGFGGSMSYRFSDHWSMTLFGEYYSGANPLNPAQAGYFNAPRFGGYVSYDANEHWGVSVGAQSERSIMTNSWETRPIVMPYYKIGEAKIGVDVGGILYEVLKDYTGGHRGSPVIGPPRMGPPPVAPRK